MKPLNQVKSPYKVGRDYHQSQNLATLTLYLLKHSSKHHLLSCIKFHFNTRYGICICKLCETVVSLFLIPSYAHSDKQNIIQVLMGTLCSKKFCMGLQILPGQTVLSTVLANISLVRFIKLLLFQPYEAATQKGSGSQSPSHQRGKQRLCVTICHNELCSVSVLMCCSHV